MIIFVVFTSLFLIFYVKTINKTGLSPFLLFLVAGISLVFFYSEHIISGLPLFYSDEITYMSSSTSVSLFMDRFLWYFINNLMLEYDVTFNGFMLKMVNIPVAAGFLFVLWHIFKNKKIFLLPIILPYFSFTATKNLRDIPILFLSILSIFMFYNRKSLYSIIGFICLGLLFLLRPFAVGVIIIIMLSQMGYQIGKRMIKLKIYKVYIKKIIVLAIIILFLAPVVGPYIKITIEKNINSFFYSVTGDGQDERAESRVQNDPRYASGNIFKDFIVACIRYVLTPIPTSIITRAISGGSEWGVVDDLLMICNQIIYYMLLAFLITHARFIPKIISKMNSGQKVIILYLLSYLPIYSFFLYGVSHQRLKIPFQVAVLLFVLLILGHKKRVIKPYRKQYERLLDRNPNLQTGYM